MAHAISLVGWLKHVDYSLSLALSEHVKALQSFIEQGEKFPPPVMWMKVDVRDVALAHIRAAESPTAKVSDCLHLLQIHSHCM